MKSVFSRYLSGDESFWSSYAKLVLTFLLLTLVASTVWMLISFSKEERLSVSFLDVGQGDAIYMKTPGGYDMLIDGGVSQIVLEKISEKMSLFDRRIDVVVSTHPDADHVTGLISILKYYDVGAVIISPSGGDTEIYDEFLRAAKEEGVPIITAKRGDEIIFEDGVKATVMYPFAEWSKDDDGDTNSASVSMLVSYSTYKILLTGDLPSLYEKFLLDKELSKSVTIYKAGHHGSKHSSSDYLLSYSMPKYTVISAGENNRYGHPNNETLERLKKYSSTIFSTVDSGTVTFILGKNINVITEK